MPQSRAIMAFRKRLAKHGYRNITIKRDGKNDRYRVEAVEPLAGKHVKTKMDELDMYEAFR